MAVSLEQSRDEVVARTAELERSNRELDQFAAVTSHDLKEPLQTVTVFAGLLDRDYREQLDESGRTFLDSILASADRMRALIRDLLEFSRVGHGELQCEPVPAELMLERARGNLAGHIAERNATLTVEPLPTVRVDAAQLSQVFQNLLSNALKFSDDEAPLVHVSAVCEADAWRFSVRDNGIGIDPVHAERIFKPFARIGANREGTGIGLAICQRIVEHHGGRIWVEGVPGGGSTFHFTIPDMGDDETRSRPRPSTRPSDTGRLESAPSEHPCAHTRTGCARRGVGAGVVRRRRRLQLHGHERGQTDGPGADKPPVTIGTKNFPEEFILGELYAQALRARGSA